MGANLLADTNDLREWLPVGELPNSKYQVEAYRIIRTQLAGVFTPVEMHEWVSPATTPTDVRRVAGRLTVALATRDQQLYDDSIRLLKLWIRAND